MACSLQVAGNDFMQRIRELEGGEPSWSLFTDKGSLCAGRWELPEIAELPKTIEERDFLLL